MASEADISVDALWHELNQVGYFYEQWPIDAKDMFIAVSKDVAAMIAGDKETGDKVTMKRG